MTKIRPDNNGIAQKGNLKETKRNTGRCLFAKRVTKQVHMNKATPQNANSQRDVIKLKALRISVIIVTDTPNRMAVNKNNSRKKPDKEFVFEIPESWFIWGDSPKGRICASSRCRERCNVGLSAYCLESSFSSG